MNELNIVYIGEPTFPLGFATTKRRRYMIDYLNSQGIESHYLCTRYKKSIFDNSAKGDYGLCSYYDLYRFFENRNIFSYWRKGQKILHEWYNINKTNILIFTTSLSVFEYSFFKYAQKLGYKIIFDIVETSFTAPGTEASMHTKLKVKLENIVNRKAKRKAYGAFVISSALEHEVSLQYPHLKLCYLQNSTPIIEKPFKTKLSTPLKVLYSGTYAPKDGVKYLIEGVIKANNSGCNCNLILTGKGADKDMKNVYDNKHLSYIDYRGFISDEEMMELQQNSDVLCMTRTNSTFANFGFPFKLSEYLATGNIVLASNVGDVCKFIKDKKDAYIVAPESSDDIANVLWYISEHEENALEVGRNGFKTAKEKFSIGVVGQRFLDFMTHI